MKKLLSLLMALILICALLPTEVFADTEDSAGTPAATSQENTTNSSKKGPKPNNGKPNNGKPGDGRPDGKHHNGKHKRKPVEAAHDHEYSGYGSNPTYHWLQCACGCKINVEPHVDPLDTDDDYCFCGYHFSDNADLVTLWIDGCPPIKGFNKNKTEYKLDAYTYKDVKEIKVSTRTFDSEATVELPEDLTLKEGENKFEIKVIAENQKVTKVYTVIVNKEVKK